MFKHDEGGLFTSLFDNCSAEGLQAFEGLACESTLLSH